MKRLSSTTVLCTLLAALYSLSSWAAAETPTLTVKNIELFKKRGDQVEWCRENNKIAYAGRGPDDLYGLHVCDADGGNDVWITQNSTVVPPFHKGSPTWHPSGKYILFVAEKAKHPGPHHWSTPGIGSYSDLWVITPDGSRAWQLTDTPVQGSSGIIIPKFSHDGKHVVWADRIERSKLANPKAFCALWDLKVADFTDGSDGPRLTNIKVFRPGGGKAFNESYGFTPDDTGIIFCSDFNQKTFWSSQIFTVDLATGQKITQLTEKGYNEHACYTPDGQQIVWMTSFGNFGGTDWWIMNADGSNKTRLTYFNKRGHAEFSKQKLTCCLGSFSPSGKQFVGGVQDSLIKQTGDSYMLTFR